MLYHNTLISRKTFSIMQVLENGKIVLAFFNNGNLLFEKEYNTRKGAKIAQNKLWFKYLAIVENKKTENL